MLEEILALLRESAQDLASSPAAAQAEQDVKDVEAIAAKHAAAAVDDVKNWLIARLHPVLGSAAPAENPPV